MLELDQTEKRFLRAFGLVSGLCLVMFLARFFVTGTVRFAFVPENLALAWLALIFAWALSVQLKTKALASWQNISLSLLWLLFLPNTWYVLTDFVHAQSTGQISQMFDIVLISTLVFAGFTLGFTSLFIVHKQLLKRWRYSLAHLAIGAVLLSASFAIYLGRDLRWNSWDIVTNPGGIILNVSDRIIDPFGHPRALNVTVLFFVLLSTLYLAIWQFLGPYARLKK